MTNNNTLRSLRYTFDFSDSKMIEIFSLAEHEVTRAQVSEWLKKDDDPDYKDITDIELSIFLNGLISDKRGKKDGPAPAHEKRITNNIILKKLKIALDLKSEDVMNVFAQTDLKISNHELTAFFRKPDHKNYRKCQHQVLRNFLKGLQLKHRPSDSVEVHSYEE